MLFPSQYEQFGIVALEAAASGRPLLGTPVGIMQSLVPHYDFGLLHPFGDVDQFFANLIKVLDSGRYRENAERHRQEILLTYDWRSISMRMKKSTAVQRPGTCEPAISGCRTSPARPAASGIARDLLEHGIAAARGGVRISLSVPVRRSFGLDSGYYDAALGIANSILFYTGLGLSSSLPRFIPELQLTAGGQAAMQLIARLDRSGWRPRPLSR